MEVWKDIAGFEGAYQVSSLGRVRSVGRLLWFTSKLGRRCQRMSKTKLLSACDNGVGYDHLALCRDGKVYDFVVHILVLNAFEGPCPAGMECMHGNGVRNDNRIGNLAWGTPSANNRMKKLHGTSNEGERNAQAKLEPSEALAIRSGFMSRQRAAIAYGVSPTTISDIRAKRTWRHVG